MARLTTEQRGQAIGMLQAGRSQAMVSRILRCARSSISRLWLKFQQTGKQHLFISFKLSVQSISCFLSFLKFWYIVPHLHPYHVTQRFKIPGHVQDLPRASRSRVTTQAQDNRLRTQHLRDRYRPATRTAAITIGNHGRPISAQTVINRLRRHGIRPRRPYVGPQLLQRHRRARLQWCRAHVRWQAGQWHQVLFSDESRFTLERSDGRARVYRRTGERYTDACVKEADRFRGRSVMVWAGISHARKTNLVVINGNLNAQRYRDEILAPVVVPYTNANPNAVFQQDNARPHTARLTTHYLQANNVNVMEWPSKSPDLSPIEHVWDLLDRRVRQRPVQPQTLRQLQMALVQEWNNIPMNVIRRYLRSMRRRCRAVIQSAGGHTRY